MIEINTLLQKLDDALDQVVHQKEPESFLKPIVSSIEEYQKNIRQVQAQFTDAPQFNEEGAYPQFLSCGLLEIKGKNGANTDFLLPKVYPFPPKSLYIEHEKDGQFLREMLMRLLSSAPLVQLEVVLVDALSLGGIFNLARRLLNKDNDFIYQQRILTESKEIEEALKHLYEYLKVNLQTKLAGYKDFVHYNEGKEDKLPLKALFLSGVDALSSDALYYLEKIMRFGSKNGVLSFVNLESEKNKSAEDLKRYAEFFKDRTSFERLKYLSVEVINDHGIQSQHMQDFATKIKAYYEKKKAVKRELKDLQKDEKFWTESSQYEVSVPVGWDINHKEVCFEIGEAQNHTLICDHSGSGKSNFLHVLIQNLAFYYAPDEVQLFLLDYKEGVEFNAYTDPNILEHARLVSVASSVGFGMSFLSWLCKEMQERANLFKQFKVKDLNNYRKHEKMPRLIVVIDEFQVLFSDNSTQVKESVEQPLNTLLKKGRSYGVHLVLATQTMRGGEIDSSIKAQIANRIALPMDADDSTKILDNDVACEIQKPEAIFNNNGGHQKYHTKMSIPKAPDDFTAFIKKIHEEFNQRNLTPIDRKIYNGETPLKMPNILKANEMRLHLGKKVDYEQNDLIVEFESNESHLLVVSQDLNARIALMKLLFQNIKSANKELVFCNKEKRLIRSFDAQKEYGITPVENILSVLDTAMNPNSALVIDNLNEAKEWHDKVGAEKLKSFLEKATDNEQYCVIFAHDYKQIKTNYHLDKLRELLSNHFKQRLAFRCNEENLNAIKNNLPPPRALNNLNALFVELSKDSVTEFRPFSL
ncbi:FtsK/SpoIIIE domain-containing protein [Helicobacter pylori]|uniref:FtsK/SpoIIIE domain-containing protein n=1 Tax=Helicobacter pylori TaxID=210 RepID=UPI000FDE2DF1|nr:FtsK/SpoIIIE domain-containing protein [Helicobacter pylori]RVZ66080.1 DNA translocase FtsK [Helicobacter pylori]